MSEAINIEELNQQEESKNEIAHHQEIEYLDEAQRFLIFKVGVNYYGAPLLSVQEVMEEQTIKPVPYAPSYFLGIMNLRGKIISVLDLRSKFRIPQTENEKKVKYIMILDLENTSIGVMIDKIVSVQHLSPKEISHLPSVEANIRPEYIIGATRIDDRLITLVQLSKLIEKDEVERFLK
ncbi:MAG: purine-binding chemotaxis protein CheW [Halobacteriovoraceae bacterium]|nr:purine-binding chemotaxis protein CheW [Halobacteriovoraceae bacterium]